MRHVLYRSRSISIALAAIQFFFFFVLVHVQRTVGYAVKRTEKSREKAGDRRFSFRESTSICMCCRHVHHTLQLYVRSFEMNQKTQCKLLFGRGLRSPYRVSYSTVFGMAILVA